jgi:ABC-type uncharacterized transport system involved in gliding motility auxiliary subunit
LTNTRTTIAGNLATVLVCAAVVIRLFFPMWSSLAYWAAAAAMAWVLLYVAIERATIVRALRRRATMFSASASLSVVAALFILLAVNFLAIRRDITWDLTTQQAFKLSEQTRKVLDSLTSPITAYVVARPDGFGRFREILTAYEQASPNIRVEYVDADRHPARVKEWGVINYGTVVFEQNGRRLRVMLNREQELTNALIRLTKGRDVKAYFTQGHGERALIRETRASFTSALSALERDNYKIESLLLAQAATVPADASLLIVAGPSVDFLPSETEVLQEYLRRGGKALLLLDPVVGSDMRHLPVLESALAEWGISLGHDVVVDTIESARLPGADASLPVIVTYPSHEATRDFSLLTAYPLAQSVRTIAGSTTGRRMGDVVRTSDRSWSTSSVDRMVRGQEPVFDERIDRRGPLTLAVSVTQKVSEGGGETRLIVVGDSDFAANAMVGIQGNVDMFVNMTNWLTEQGDLISVRPRGEGDQRITLTAVQFRGLRWFSVVVVPALIVLSGVRVWWRRRSV